MAQELKIVASFYDFVLWMTHHVEKFPRHHRHSLGMSIENRMQAILALILRAQRRNDERKAGVPYSWDSRR